MEAIPMIRSSSSGSVPPTTSTQLEMPQDTLLQQAPLCPTTNEENRPYSWALITTSTPPPPSSANQDVNLSTTNNPVPFSQSSPFTGNTTDMTFNHHDYLQLGFTFHKPPSSTQRFLEGKPRLKRRSTSNSKRHQQSMSTLMMAACGIPMTMANLTIDTNSSSTSSSSASLTTPPSSTLSPEVPSFNNPNMDLQFDYLTQQLETLSSHHPDTSSLNDVEEFTTILSNILLPQVSHPTPTPTPTTPPPPPPLLSQQQQPIRSHCGSFVPLSNCCQDLGVNGGESVVITITPLLTDPSKQQTNTTTSTTTTTTTTRIVTCYCGQQCICPGCLVHPGNFLLGNDPYTGLLPSSSSSCYCSDEEDTSNKTTMIVEANTNDIFNLNNNTNYMSFSPS
ncbi:uncharacterized protein BX663DRAFT_66459 [Cokeromyces recurvatus]|uniref:uncharacterized protein n=1 Tax=Cokeromyces recurvatus TaxID=90255 RepID=UPI00221FA740|nr:uncharacterized protein BX663DRAFT_66459 [Cokeromyces recurvatus]KAI7902685.1 hypothetical protein BX663DRAFT_66459 [Cokeromyces recurvatus]